MQRDRRYRVETFVARQGARQQFGQRTGQSFHSAVFIEVDQLPQHAFVSAETVRRVEAAQSAAAKGTTALGIQRERIDEGGAARNAEKLGA